MFGKLIVGVDGSDGSRDAVALAGLLTPEAELVLVFAYPHNADAPPEALEWGRALEGEARRTLERERDEAGVRARSEPIADRSPARALHRVAEREHADLLVVGSCRHRAALGRVLLGDVARATVHHAPCPVAVAPRGFAQRAARAQVIGVGFDGSPEAREALGVAAELAGALGASLRLRAVPSVPAPGTPAYGAPPLDWEAVVEAQRRAGRKALDEAIAGLQVPAEGEVVMGPVGEQLELLSQDVDLMVCGSRGWGAVKRVMLGSTSDRLLHNAACPVIVVPRGAAPASASSRGAAQEARA